ncbi:MAG TPA: DUF222 domain-containing protein, partial [Woeseiaceae bacterium]|nr:DUF222 domain-containing protein [Woeseiaceae bacterium]
DDAVRAFARRSLTVRRDHTGGTMIITVELPLETGELIDKALDRARDTTASSNPEFAEESWAAQQADALVAMARAYLSGGGQASGGTSDHYQVTVHVDRAALVGGQGRSGLPIESVRRLSCDGERVILVEDKNGEPLSIGRKARIVPTAIKRALWARDRACRFPGCGRTRYVDAHHIEHWSAGGETSLTNLMLLCTQHHQLVHEGGFRIEKDYRDRWFFKRPDGRAVPACGYRPEDISDDDVAAGEYPDGHPSAEAFPADHTSAEGFLAGLKNSSSGSDLMTATARSSP